MSKATFNWADPFLLDSQLAADERLVRDAARQFAQKALQPRVRDAFRNEHTDPAIFREMGDMGLLGATLPPQYGGAGLNYVSYGLIAREIEYVDSGYRSMLSVQSSLVMLPIFAFGSETIRTRRSRSSRTPRHSATAPATRPNRWSSTVRLPPCCCRRLPTC